VTQIAGTNVDEQTVLSQQALWVEIAENIPYLTARARYLTRGDRHAADDLVQQTMCLAIAKSHLFTPGTGLKQWLYTILRNCHTSNVRARATVTLDPVQLEDCLQLCCSAPQFDWERLHDVRRAYMKLEKEHREVLNLVALQGLTYQQAANDLQIQVGTVRSRANRARNALAALCDLRR
jgi:RNA polymerase sigma-70 factor (ECF subfamily)